MKYKKTPCPSRHGVFLVYKLRNRAASTRFQATTRIESVGCKQHFYYLQIILENFQYCFMVGVFQLVEAL